MAHTPQRETNSQLPEGPAFKGQRWHVLHNVKRAFSSSNRQAATFRRAAEAASAEQIGSRRASARQAGGQSIEQAGSAQAGSISERVGRQRAAYSTARIEDLSTTSGVLCGKGVKCVQGPMGVKVGSHGGDEGGVPWG